MKPVSFLFAVFALISVMGCKSAETSTSSSTEAITPPRLRIVTTTYGEDWPFPLGINSVQSGQLADRIGLKAHDLITHLIVNDQNYSVKTSMDLSRALVAIRERALIGPEVPVEIGVLRPGFEGDEVAEMRLLGDRVGQPASRTPARRVEGGAALKLIGWIIRTEHSDRIDGGTLYFWRSRPAEEVPPAP